MTYRIMQMSDYTSHILKDKQNGVIHSVYRKTINMNIDGSLLALQAIHSPLSPISLLTELDEDSMKAFDIKEGEFVQITDTSIKIGSTIFSFEASEIIPCKLKDSLSSAQCIQLRENLKTAISSSHTGGFDTVFHNFWDKSLPLPSLILEGAHSYISQAYYSIQAKDYTSFSSFLTRLIGLGTGLTPSGDDFLCGVLAGLILSGNWDSHFADFLKASIENALSNTNDISRAFLRCSLEKNFSLPVNQLLTVPDAEEIISSFQQIGHSSGIDTLCGIYFILCITHKKEQV